MTECPADNLSDQILEMVTRHGGGVTFVELERLPGFGGGDGLMKHDKDGVVLWVDVSDAGVKALNDLLARKLIYGKPTSPMTYLIDGKMLKLPLAKSKRYYKRPHWLPVTLNPGTASVK